MMKMKNSTSKISRMGSVDTLVKRRLGISILLVFSIKSAFAWNSFGHMVVAAVAYDHLTTESTTRVAALLKLNPEYSTWVADTSPEYKDEVAFMRAATWPDYIKHAKGYSNDGEKPKGAKASQNIGYSDKLMHKYWHYEDLPFSPDPRCQDSCRVI